MCSPWGHKELDTTWQLNNNNKNEWFHVFSFPKKKFFFNFVFVYPRSLLWRVGFSLQWLLLLWRAHVRGQVGTVVVV